MKVQGGWHHEKNLASTYGDYGKPREVIGHEKVMSVETNNSQARKRKQVRTLSIVIPTLNEENAIERVIKAIPTDELNEMGFEVQILVVDNGSDDRTVELAKKVGAEVIYEPIRGYGRAYKSGFAQASGDLIATADADLTYPMEDIPKLVKLLIDEDLDFVTTNRFVNMDPDAMSFRNIFGNVILNLVTRLLYRIDLKDSQSGMWLFRKDLLDRMKCRSDGMAFSQELKLEAIHFCNCRWREVPIKYSVRVGQLKLSGWRDGFGNLLALIRKRFVR